MRRSMRWTERVKSVFNTFTLKKAGPDEIKQKTPKFSSWIPNVPYLEVVECYSGVEIYRGEGKFWVEGEAVSSLIKARKLAKAISNHTKWLKAEMQSWKRQPD